jgi:hypothetical protein
LIKNLFTLSFTLIAMLGSIQIKAQPSMPEPNWSLAMARSAAGSIEVQTALKPLFQLAREGKDELLLQELANIEKRSDWPLPAREYVLHRFASGLGDLQAWTVGPGVLEYLESYQAQTLVPHGDHARAGVPLFNIRSAAIWQVSTGPNTICVHQHSAEHACERPGKTPVLYKQIH